MIDINSFNTKRWAGLPRGKLPYKKDGGARRTFWKEPLRGPKILFCGHGLKFCSPLRDTNTETTHLLSVNFFSRLSTLKGAAKAPAVSLLGPNTLRGTKTALLTPERYNKYPPPFYIGFQVTGMIEGFYWVWKFWFWDFDFGKFWQVFFWGKLDFMSLERCLLFIMV